MTKTMAPLYGGVCGVVLGSCSVREAGRPGSNAMLSRGALSPTRTPGWPTTERRSGSEGGYGSVDQKRSIWAVLF